MGARLKTVLGVMLAAIVAAVAVLGFVVGWSTLWRSMTGWWTQGWGNLFTVGVAVIAIGVSGLFNRLTLRKADQRFIQERIDARNDKLREEMAGLFTALSERASLSETYSRRMGQIGRPTDIPGFRNWAKVAKPVVEDTIAVWQRRIAGHALVVSMLTDDQNITGCVERLEEVTTKELTQLRNFITRAEKADADDLRYLQTLALIVPDPGAGPPRQEAVDGITTELRDYCLPNLRIVHSPSARSSNDLLPTDVYVGGVPYSGVADVLLDLGDDQVQKIRLTTDLAVILQRKLAEQLPTLLPDKDTE